MNQRSGSVRIIFAAAAAAILIGCVLPATALARKASPRLTASVSAANPLQGKTITAYAGVVDVAGRSVKGAKVTFVWPGARKAVVTYALTNKHGTAASARVVDQAFWKAATVVMSVKVGTKTVGGKASYVPLPVPSSRHPVTIKIGAALPLTQGAVAIGQGMLKGVRLAVAQADASATVTGLGIRFVVAAADDKGDPKTAVTVVASALANDPTVLGVAGHLNSGCSIPASKVYSNAKIVMVTGASTNPALTTQGLGNVFRTTYSDSQQGPAAARGARVLGCAKAFVVDDTTAYGIALAGDFATSFTSQGGTVAAHVHTSDSATNFSAVVTQIQAAAPDVVYYGGIYDAGGRFAHQLRAAGVTAPVMGGDGLYDPAFIQIATAASAEGDFATSCGYPVSALPDGGSFATSYTAAFPGATPTDYDAYSYDSAQVIMAAICRQAKAGGTAWVGTLTGRKGVISQVHATDAVGATGRIRFDSHGERLDPEIALYKVVSGAWTYQNTP